MGKLLVSERDEDVVPSKETFYKFIEYAGGYSFAFIIVGSQIIGKFLDYTEGFYSKEYQTFNPETDAEGR